MSKSKRIETIFHNSEPDGIRTYMRYLSPIRTYVVLRQYLSEAKGSTGTDNPNVYFLVSDEAGVLTKLYIGQTRSGASDFVLGGSTNGWVEWRDKDGKTLDELYRKQANN